MVYENWLACFSVFKRKDATDREFFGNLLFVEPSIHFALNSLILLSITLSLFSKNVSALTHNGSRCILYELHDWCSTSNPQIWHT